MKIHLQGEFTTLCGRHTNEVETYFYVSDVPSEKLCKKCKKLSKDFQQNRKIKE